MEITIERMSLDDREEVISIFDEGVKSGDLVLDIDNPGSQDLAAGRNLVARAAGTIIGWAVVDPAGSKLQPGVATVSVFVKPGYRRNGIGRALLDAAVDLAAGSGIATLVSGIAPKNVPALLLHKKCGFKAVGMLQRAGISRGKWQDAVLLQRDCRSGGEAGQAQRA